MRSIAPLILGSFLSGCSLFLVDGRPSPPLDPNRHFDCTTSQAAPAVDVALGALFAGLGTATLATLPKSPCNDFSCIGGDVAKGGTLVEIGAAAHAHPPVRSRLAVT
jgi:hypothetical protein